MVTVQAQCGWRSAGVRGGRWTGRIRSCGFVAHPVASKVGSLDVVAHGDHEVVAHRLHVHQGAAVVEVEGAVPVVLHLVAEVHELGRCPDVELHGP